MITRVPQLKEVRFDLRHEGCWLQETTEALEGVTLFASPMYAVDGSIHIDLTVHVPDQERLEAVQARWEKDPRVERITRVHLGATSARFHISYTWEDSVYHHILQHTPISMGPVRIAGGVEHYNILGELQDIQDLLRALDGIGHVRLRAVRGASQGSGVADPRGLGPDIDGPHGANGSGLGTATAEPGAGLTERQFEAVLVAQQRGYYKWPRQTSAAELASMLGLSSSGFLDHLRQAEAKLLARLVHELASHEPDRARAVLERVRSLGTP